MLSCLNTQIQMIRMDLKNDTEDKLKNEQKVKKYQKSVDISATKM